jgi:hypothetical protein
MNNEHIFNDALDNTDKIFELYLGGAKILCPRCKSELLVVSNHESAVKNKTKPGIYCPQNTSHVCRWLISASEHRKFWNNFQEKMQNK